MHKLLLLAFSNALILAAFPASAARIDVADAPGAVIQGLKSEHPEAKNIKIDKEKHFGLTLYEVKFKSNGEQHETLFTPQGKHFGHEQPVASADLPRAIIKTLDSTFRNYSIKDAEIIRHPDGRIEYEIDVHGDGSDWELAMSPSGRILVRERD